MLAWSVVIFINVILDPYPIWDMLGYAASVYSVKDLTAEQIHTTVYTGLRDNVDLATYLALTESNSYRLTMSLDAQAFNQQIPFYKIRVLYIVMLFVADSFGFDIFSSMHFLAAFFGSVGFLILYFAMRTHLHPFIWLLFPFIFFGITTNFLLLRQGGVDAFAFFWMSLLTALYFRNSKFLMPVLAISVLVRTDMILFAMLMYGILLLSDKKSLNTVVAWALITVACFITVNVWAGNYGWFTLIYFVFSSNMTATHPEIYSVEGAFTLSQYMEFIFSAYSWVSPWLWLSIGCGILSMIVFTVLVATNSGQRENEQIINQAKKINLYGAICFAYILLHYLLFPAFFMRFFTGHCVFMVLSLLCTLQYTCEYFIVTGKFRKINLDKRTIDNTK